MTVDTILRPERIREAIAEQVRDLTSPLWDPAYQGVNAGEPQQSDYPPEGPVLWWDLRPSEAARLARTLDDAQERAVDRMAIILMEEMRAAAESFDATLSSSVINGGEAAP